MGKNRGQIGPNWGQNGGKKQKWVSGGNLGVVMGQGGPQRAKRGDTYGALGNWGQLWGTFTGVGQFWGSWEMRELGTSYGAVGGTWGAAMGQALDLGQTWSSWRC